MKSIGVIAKTLFLFLIGKFVVLFGVNSMFSFYYKATTDSGELSELTLNHAANISTLLSSILILVVLFYWKPLKGLKDSWKKITPIFLSLVLFLGLLGFALNSVVLSFFKSPYEEAIELSKSLLNSGWISVLGVALFVPIVEEVIFRRICIESLRKEMGVVPAILVSAIVFGILHINPIQILGATLLGLLFGCIYELSKSVLPGILLHVFNNGMYVYKLRFDKMETSSVFFTKENPYIWLVVSLLCVLFMVTAYFAYKQRVKSEDINL